MLELLLLLELDDELEQLEHVVYVILYGFTCVFLILVKLLQSISNMFVMSVDVIASILSTTGVGGASVSLLKKMIALVSPKLPHC